MKFKYLVVALFSIGLVCASCGKKKKGAHKASTQQHSESAHDSHKHDGHDH